MQRRVDSFGGHGEIPVAALQLGGGHLQLSGTLLDPALEVFEPASGLTGQPPHARLELATTYGCTRPRLDTNQYRREIYAMAI
jgi:hypothetical protein